MQITITSTDELTRLDGVPVRRWQGRTAGGIPCHVFVHRLAIVDGVDPAEFEAELREQPVPQEAEAAPTGSLPQDDPRFHAYVEHMQRMGTAPVAITTTVASLMVLISTVQLALRHPQFPERVRPDLDAFLAEATTRLGSISGVLADVAQLGNDPAHDMPTLPEDTNG